MKVQRISARRIPHIFTDDQKRVRVQSTKQLLEMILKFNQRQFAYIVTGDESWVH